MKLPSTFLRRTAPFVLSLAIQPALFAVLGNVTAQVGGRPEPVLCGHIFRCEVGTNTAVAAVIQLPVDLAPGP